MPSSAVFARPDTLLGVCQALGDDLGFNPLWLRIALAVLLLWNPVVVLSAYFGAAVIVLASRTLFPARSGSQPIETTEPADEIEQVYAKAA